MERKDYIAEFRQKLVDKIDSHSREKDRLNKWLDCLEQDGFNWDEVTESQAWAIWNLEPAGVTAKEGK